MNSFFRDFRCPPAWLLAMGLLAGLSAPVVAQGYSISSYKIASGGGAIAGGGFTLNGSIGQHDMSARISGGTFSLAAGFLPGIRLVQTPPVPTLSVANTGANKLQILWPSFSVGWVLQQNADLSSTNWINNALTVSDDGDDRWITLVPTTNRLFFRLRKP